MNSNPEILSFSNVVDLLESLLVGSSPKFSEYREVSSVSGTVELPSTIWTLAGYLYFCICISGCRGHQCRRKGGRFAWMHIYGFQLTDWGLEYLLDCSLSQWVTLAPSVSGQFLSFPHLLCQCGLVVAVAQTWPFSARRMPVKTQHWCSTHNTLTESRWGLWVLIIDCKIRLAVISKQL